MIIAVDDGSVDHTRDVARRVCDVTIGLDHSRGKGAALRVANMLTSAAIGAMVGVTVPDAQSGYRAIRRTVLDFVKPRGDRYEYEMDLLIRALRAGFRVTAIPVPTVYCTPSHFRRLGDSVRLVRTIWTHVAGAVR